MTNRTPGALPPINFAALARELLGRAESLVPLWLPGGKTSNGEYLVSSFWRSEKTPSLSVRLTGENAGKWGDFGGDHKGGDLISLYAAIHGMDMGHAAVELARQYGLEDVAGVQRAAAGGGAPPRPPPPPPPAAEPAPKPEKESDGWRTLTPVPDWALAATFKHQWRKPEDIEHLATYRMDGALLGYVVRFRKSDGGKETLPHTWCVSARDGTMRWHWKQWDEPRPLYFPGGVSPLGLYNDGKPGRTVVVVEGEKKAEILQNLLDGGAPGVYLVVSWPGGSKAWKKALWEWLAGCTVILWPDCDGKRELLTKAEREQYADDMAREIAQQAKPLLPAHKQVGMVAMLGIGALLRDDHMCTVQILPIPEPGTVVDGWDCADAINTDGWDFARVQAFFASAHALPSEDGRPAANAAGGGGSDEPPEKKRDGPAGAEPRNDEFSYYLEFLSEKLKCEIGQLVVNRKLVIKALRIAPLLRDCLGYNELTGAPSTRVAWPWRSEAGPLKDSDDLRLGDFLCTTYKLKAASRAALAEAMDTVADERRFHPIRDWLKVLKHDGKPRADKWLIHVLGHDPAALAPRRRRYLELVGRYLLMGLVYRVMEPGCKFDYSPVFEGLTGMRKSTLVKTLVSKPFFSDTHFDIGSGKDGFEQLEGLWGYELSELTALRKADSEQVKQFFSSEVDRFRGAYGRFVQAHPRQCVIFCSTNKTHYLYDLTGNRRFWPVEVLKPINIDWVSKWRDQLFAEAMHLYQAGERCYPDLAEEETYFVPEQKLRLVETAVQSRLFELLTREGASAKEGTITADLNQLVTFITLDRLVSALGADAAKSNSILEGQIRGWLESHGWKYGRESTGQRRRGYKQPSKWPPEIEDDDGAVGAVKPAAPNTDDPPGAGEVEASMDDEPF